MRGRKSKQQRYSGMTRRRMDQRAGAGFANPAVMLNHGPKRPRKIGYGFNTTLMQPSSLWSKME